MEAIISEYNFITVSFLPQFVGDLSPSEFEKRTRQWVWWWLVEREEEWWSSDGGQIVSYPRIKVFAQLLRKLGQLKSFKLVMYCKSGNFRCKNIFIVDGSYENKMHMHY